MMQVNHTRKPLKTIQAVESFFRDNDLEVEREDVEIPGPEQDGIFHLSLDSRVIEAGDLFIALQGEQSHGLDFIEQVLKKSPAVIISDRSMTAEERALYVKTLAGLTAPSFFVVEAIRQQMGEFASWFYDQPSQQLKVVGITGTNGKTSTAFFAAQLLEQMDQKVALIGTLGNGVLSELEKSANTTPDAVNVQRLLYGFRQRGIEWVVMEVSSHALCLGRIQGVQFNSVALTQVTRDHLDFHGTEAAYHQAKLRLFKEYEAQHQIINIDDRLGREVLLLNTPNQNKLAYQPVVNKDKQKTERREKYPLLQVQRLSLGQNGLEGEFNFQDETWPFQAPLMGGFNIENLMCALSILLANDFPLKSLLSNFDRLQSVPGRMQVVHQSPAVIVDFAHTPDALEQVLIAITAHQSDKQGQGKLYTVFGCGGNRDQGKRPLMGKVAESYSDQVMLTSDNPRDEAPEAIIDQALEGAQKPESMMVEVERSLAIEQVLQQAGQKDIVVIAGKGHEDYQEIKGKRYPYSDQAVVERWFKRQSDHEHD